MKGYWSVEMCDSLYFIDSKSSKYRAHIVDTNSDTDTFYLLMHLQTSDIYLLLRFFLWRIFVQNKDRTCAKFIVIYRIPESHVNMICVQFSQINKVQTNIIWEHIKTNYFLGRAKKLQYKNKTKFKAGIWNLSVHFTTQCRFNTDANMVSILSIFWINQSAHIYWSACVGTTRRLWDSSNNELEDAATSSQRQHGRRSHCPETRTFTAHVDEANVSWTIEG